MFIQEYLSKNDIGQRRWYTSGQEIGGRWIWTTTNAVFTYDQGFLPSAQTDMGSNVVYAYRCMLHFFNSVAVIEDLNLNFSFQLVFGDGLEIWALIIYRLYAKYRLEMHTKL